MSGSERGSVGSKLTLLGGVFRSGADPVGRTEGADSHSWLQRGDNFYETQ